MAENMSDDELDNVVGGTAGQMLSDAEFLTDFGFLEPGLVTNLTINDPIGAYYIFGKMKLEAAWGNAGITCKSDRNEFNSYYDSSGNEISRIDAMIKVAESRGVNLENLVRSRGGQAYGISM